MEGCICFQLHRTSQVFRLKDKVYRIWVEQVSGETQPTTTPQHVALAVAHAAAIEAANRSMNKATTPPPPVVVIPSDDESESSDGSTDSSEDSDGDTEFYPQSPSHPSPVVSPFQSGDEEELGELPPPSPPSPGRDHRTPSPPAYSPPGPSTPGKRPHLPLRLLVAKDKRLKRIQKNLTQKF